MYRLKMGLVIVFAGVLAMLLITPYDQQWIYYLADHRVEWFIEVMSESLFELEKPGGGDIVVLFVTISLLLYCAASLVDAVSGQLGGGSRLQKWLLKNYTFASFLRRYRLQLEFLVVSSFCCSILMVKMLKWIMARPRPKKIFIGTRDFYEWYEVGPYLLDEGLYRASFPSGHTASAITLIGLAYVLTHTASSRQWRLFGKLLMGASLCFAGAMAVARVMSGAHWPTDVTFSIFFGWLLIHLLFFYGYHFSPNHNISATGHAECGFAPPYRGIKTCWYLALAGLSIVGIFLGFKHVIHDRWSWLILVCLPALPILLYSIKEIKNDHFRS